MSDVPENWIPVQDFKILIFIYLKPKWSRIFVSPFWENGPFIKRHDGLIIFEVTSSWVATVRSGRVRSVVAPKSSSLHEKFIFHIDFFFNRLRLTDHHCMVIVTLKLIYYSDFAHGIKVYVSHRKSDFASWWM